MADRRSALLSHLVCKYGPLAIQPEALSSLLASVDLGVLEALVRMPREELKRRIAEAYSQPVRYIPIRALNESEARTQRLNQEAQEALFLADQKCG